MLFVAKIHQITRFDIPVSIHEKKRQAIQPFGIHLRTGQNKNARNSIQALVWYFMINSLEPESQGQQHFTGSTVELGHGWGRIFVGQRRWIQQVIFRKHTGTVGHVEEETV